MKKTLSAIIVLVLVLSIGTTAAFAAPVVINGGGNGGGFSNNSTYSGTTTSSNNGGAIVFVDPSTNKPIATEAPVPTYDIVNTAPVVTKNPTAESVDYGDDVVFVARADYANTVTWYLTDGNTYFEAAAVGDHFKGVTATGTNSERLVLSGVTDKMDGWYATARFNSDAGEAWSAQAKLSVSENPNASPSPTPTPIPDAAATPTPVPANVSNGGNGGTATQHGIGTNGNLTSGSSVGNSNNTAIGNTSPDSLNNTVLTTAPSATGSAGTSRNTHIGAYVLAAIAGLVIIGSVLVMALYMKGKISLGKFEKFLGSFGNENDPEMFDDNNEFYNPDDFKDKKDT